VLPKRRTEILRLAQDDFLSEDEFMIAVKTEPDRPADDGRVNSIPAERPQRTTLDGRVVCIVPLDPATHGGVLYDATRGEQNDGLWRYLFEGPFASRAAFDAHLKQKAGSEDPLAFAILETGSGDAVGYASYMRIEPAHRVIEVGSILFTPRLQRTVGATEAMYLMARHVFEDLGYRRYEWKCNALNAPSRSAALRLGFTFEGIFRQHMIIKGYNRDTAWFSMLDSEWPKRKAAFERWLDPSNFDANGRQRVSLSALNHGS
jgi:RimJ/RimL family protein N-acetyltransferase